MAVSEEDWTKEKLAALLEAASHAINRARYVFVVINVTGVCTLTGMFNAYLPWIRNAIDRGTKMNPAPHHLGHLEKTVYQDLWTISFPLLGVKVSVFDLSVVATSAFLVLAIWQYYCVRRENHVVHSILEEAKAVTNSKECVRYLYHGIAHYFVFTTRLDQDVPAGASPQAGATFVLRALVYMPAWIPILILTSDAMSLVTQFNLQLDPNAPLFKNLSTSEVVEVFLRMAFAGIIGLICYFYCKQAQRFDAGTRADLDEFKKLTA